MENKEFDRLDAILRTKTYADLSEEERSWVDETLGRKNFEELSQMVSTLSDEKSRAVRPSVKADLLKEMKRKNRGALARWMSFRTPMYANVLAMLLLVILVWVALPAKVVIVEKPVTLRVPVVDTITVQLPSDTVFIERQVRVEVPVYLTRTEQPKEVIQKEVKGKALGEDEALRELLVSGR